MKAKLGFIIFFIVAFISLVYAGGSDESEVKVIVDGDAPVINIYKPLPNNNYPNNSALIVNYSISDKSNLSMSWYSVNFEKNLTIKANELFNLSLAEGSYVLRIYVNDSLNNFGFLDVSFNINNSAPYCGDNSCNGGESCSSCQSDCGACPVDNPGSGGGGSSGGGGGGSSTPKATPKAIELKNASVNISDIENKIIISENLSFLDIGAGEEAVIVDLYGNSYKISFIMSDQGNIMARGLNGDYIIPQGEVLPILLGDREMYVGIQEVEGNSKIVMGLDSEVVEQYIKRGSSVSAKSEGIKSMYYVFMGVGAVLILIIVVLAGINLRKKAIAKESIDKINSLEINK